MSPKQKLNQVLNEPIDRRTFLKRVGLLMLGLVGITRLLHLSELAPAQPRTTAYGGEAKLADDGSAHAKALAINSMRI